MKRLLIVLSLILAAATLSACDDADSFFFSQLPLFPMTPLAKSPDPTVRAVAESRPAVKDERAARTLLKQGLENKDPDLIAKAIERRPTNPSYYAYRSALLVGLGKTERGYDSEVYVSLKELVGVVVQNSGKEQPDPATDVLMMSFYLPATLETRNLFDAGSPEWDRLQRLACSIRRLLDKSTSTLALATLAANPVGECPPVKR